MFIIINYSVMSDISGDNINKNRLRSGNQVCLSASFFIRLSAFKSARMSDFIALNELKHYSF